MSCNCDCCERYKNKVRSDEELKLLKNRLNRIIGQLGGISKMLDDNRYCGDILTQIAAAESALQNVGYIILQTHLKTCVSDGIKDGDSEILDEAIELIKKLK
ncbi:MAG: metal-sensing transcriptional repressor [Oscillospiraceae bacterium]